MNYVLLDDSELDDFNNTLATFKCHTSDFKLKEKDTSSGQGPGKVMSGEVTIICKKTGISKTYNAGSGSSWPAEFHQDMEGGSFGI
ncbi:MAG: hypothetical protein L6437_14875 [Kiritimatiellae bacterium]|nr:hypothetical protein [Planctomycetota bacterium]MCG2661515.1 hypothetical protein [Kiritimatiellia bacterium]